MNRCVKYYDLLRRHYYVVDGVLYHTRTNEKVRTYEKNGYLQVLLPGHRSYVLAHHVVWVLAHQSLDGEIDHINHNRQDNRIENLRCVTHSENMRNLSRSKRNTTGVTGVSHLGNKFLVRRMVNGKRRSCVCASLSEAQEVLESWSKEGNYAANHGK